MDEREHEKRFMEMKEDTLCLFAIETVEFVVPLVYFITFLMAFYGPNGDIIGNIRNSDWQYKEVEDVLSFIENLIMMFLVDFTSFIISGLVLWKFSATNLLEEGYKMLKMYWLIMSIKVGGKLLQVHYM